MYDVSNEYKDKMIDYSTERRVSGTIGDISFTGGDIVLESLEVINRAAEESEVKIGGVYIGQLSLTFVPSFLNKLSKRQYIGKEIYISIGLKLQNGWEDVPLGYFTVKEANISKDGITIEAHDNMSKLDIPFNYSTTYGTIYDLARMICLDCGVELGSTQEDIQSMANGSEQLYLIEKNDIETYRDFLYWVAQTAGAFATIGRDGRLYLREFGSGPEIEIDEEHRDVDASFSDYITKWTAVSFFDIDENITKYYRKNPDDGLTMNLGSNPLVQTIMDADQAEAIAYLEGTISDLGDQIEAKEGERDYIDDQIEEVERELHDDPDNPELIAELRRLQLARAQVVADIDGLQKDKADAEKELEDLEQGITDASKVFKKRARRNILNAVARIKYTPFSIISARDPAWDLGDRLRISGGIATNETGCIMATSYKLTGYTFQGYGGNPALTDSRSSTDKSVTGISKSTDKTDKIFFSQFINAAPITIEENREKEIGHLYFTVGQTVDVETWLELKLKATLSPERRAGLRIAYYLDGQEIMAYHPEEIWEDTGAETELYLVGTILHIGTSESTEHENTHTVNYHYHLRNISPDTPHIWRVKATGLEGTEFIDTNGAHILLWAQGMKEQEGWQGIIEAKDSFPLYPIKGLKIAGTLSETVTFKKGDKILTEDGDILAAEDGDSITTANIEDLPDAEELDGTEYVPIVQNGDTVKATTQDITEST
jgi:ribosome-associated translation inhibitor RaiA